MKGTITKMPLIAVIVWSSIVCAEDLFSVCRFHFGTPDGNARNSAALMAQVDYLTAWAGSGETFNLGTFFQTCRTNEKTPVIVSYIIAFTARRDWSLQDCNVDPVNNLCKRGADYIRQQRSRIMGQYSKYARGAAENFGNTKPMVWCMEPDYTQYNDAGQNGGGLTVTQCGALMNEILDTIRKHCPKAHFSMDISPWKDTTWQKNWFNAIGMTRFTFINTSGGQARADQTFISDNWSPALPTWAWVFRTWGKPLIADAGYGVGGASTGHDTRWDNVTNLSARIRDGVLCVAQANPASTWPTTISSIRSQLPTPPKCPSGDTRTVEPAGRGASAGSVTLTNGPVMVELIDLQGKVRFRTTAAGRNSAGRSLMAPGRNLPGGTYILQTSGEGLIQREKMVIQACR
ncbi:MAG: T9SS type A sorting domain-containing protein [Chitinispirillaceae bacterium]|nr:T9SS type A sorting domain-containing protein [Chitinispirillaceae bacterium]